MSTSSIVLLIVALVLLVLVAYLVSIIIRKKNDGRIADLESRQQDLFTQPLVDELTDIRRLQLVGQSQETFADLERKWTLLSTETFRTIEEGLDDVQNYNDTFHFFKVKKALPVLEEQIVAAGQELQTIREGLTILREQEEKNSARVKYALDLYEDLQNSIASQDESFGPALAEIKKQLGHIQVEFSQFVALNSSGDPVEAADILEKAEEHTIALGQISETVPSLVTLLQKELPEQLEDLETGYAKLLEENYHFGDQPIESRFQTIREAITDAKQALSELELDKVEQAGEDIQERIDQLYDLFEQEIAAHKLVKKEMKVIPAYLAHVKANNETLITELQRLQQVYILDDTEATVIKGLTKELDKVETSVLPSLEEPDSPEQPYSVLEATYSKAKRTLETVENEQLEVLERLKQVDKDEEAARQLLDKDINRLHVIKRFMEKRHLPGIPQEFLSLFFTTSSQLEALMTELNRSRIDISTVNRLSQSASKAMASLEETAYRVVQEATLTEQLLQYSNRYRSFEPAVQQSFDTALHFFEINHDYKASFEEIAYALELVEPGVTDRFVTSYEKTRETIRF